MDTISIFTGHHHLYFTGFSRGLYPVGWIFFKILILETPIKSGLG